jgi:phosphocarrier protein FPr
VIGIVVVSHSRALADAAVALASEMTAGAGTSGGREAPVVAVAAGLDATTFGTDAAAVADAIGVADGPDGVLVFVDLGSALLSAETALEFVEPEVRGRVLVTSAPLVEGLMAAVVLASTGAPLAGVAAEARRSLAAKQEHLDDATAAGAVADAATAGAAGDAAPADHVAAAGARTEPEQSVVVTVPNPHGLHARPAARLVALARSYDARLTLTDLDTGRGPVDAASLSLVATLDARQGHRLRVTAAGPDATAALAAVTALAQNAFGDGATVGETAAGSAGSAAVDARGRGNSLPPGDERMPRGIGLDIAIGPAIVPDAEIDLTHYAASDPETEAARSAAATESATARSRSLRARTAERIGVDEAAIFDAHLALLDDPALSEDVRHAIAAGASAPRAWSDALDALATRFDALTDPYQRARAQDVRAVRRQVLTALARPEAIAEQVEPTTPNRYGAPAEGVDDVSGAGVLVVPELDAAMAATLDAALVRGVATRAGGATGHGVLVARARGIPVITDVGDVPVVAGQLVAFDARAGRFVVEPDAATVAELGRLRERRATEWKAAVAAAHEPAATTDGQRIRVLATVGSVEEARAAAALGAEGAGLVRTEVLFGDRAGAPSAEEQAAAYLAIADAFGGGPVTIRTWDAGGDKPLRFLPQAAEPNPFLGERGLRVFRRRPELLRVQLDAICRAARRAVVHVMFPMVTAPEELEWARRELAAFDPPAGLRVGMMVEVPAAAVRIERFAVDFVSIGTNDLTQYTVAADRGNAAVAGLADALDPAVLALVRRVTAHVADVAVCGDLASDPEAAALLAGLGVRELSAMAPQVPLVKARLRTTALAAATALADRSLELPGAAAVRELLRAATTGDPEA